MKTPHIKDDTLNERANARSFWIWMAVVWLWPLVLLLFTYHWHRPCVGLRLLCKSTWIVFAGVCQSWILVLLDQERKVRPKWFVPVLLVLTVASFFLLPFGLGKWEWRTRMNWDTNQSYRSYGLSHNWEYGSNLLLSVVLHMIPSVFVYYLNALVEPGVGYIGDSSSVPSSQGGDYSIPAGSGLWGKKSWLDDVWKGGQINDEYFGHRGEFDLNDEARRVSEDMQQFHNSHPDADLSDHYYWEDVLDAETDGYLD